MLGQVDGSVSALAEEPEAEAIHQIRKYHVGYQHLYENQPVL